MFIANSHNFDQVHFDGDLINFGNESIEYFGIMVPQNLAQIKSIELTGKFLLPNSHFKYSADLIGFEFWSNYGSKIITVQVTNKKNYIKNFFKNFKIQFKIMQNNQLIRTISFNTKNGYNFYLLPNRFHVFKGSSIVLSINDKNLLAINDLNDPIYSDMYWDGNEYVRLNQFENWAFYFNCKIDYSYFLQTYRFSKILDLNQTDRIARYETKKFHLTVQFNKTKNQFKKDFNISISNIFFILLFIVVEFNI